jgi:hypothetical protein
MTHASAAASPTLPSHSRRPCRHRLRRSDRVVDHHRQSASPTPQVEDSLPILNTRLPEQCVLERSLTSRNADQGIVEPRQPAIPQCWNVRVRRCFHVLSTLPWETREQSEGSLDFSPCCPCRAQPTSALLRQPVCSLHLDARRVNGEGILTSSFSGYRDRFAGAD